jgi:hypothetical protein
VHTYTSTVQFLQDWMLAVGVLVMVVIDLLVLIIFTAVVSGLNRPLVQVVPHRENLQTVTGVSRNKKNCFQAITSCNY